MHPPPNRRHRLVIAVSDYERSTRTKALSTVLCLMGGTIFCLKDGIILVAGYAGMIGLLCDTFMNMVEWAILARAGVDVIFLGIR